MPAVTMSPPVVLAPAPRRLPCVSLPGRRESLPSWVNRIGLGYQIRGLGLRTVLGLSDQAQMNPASVALDLPEQAVAALAAATGVPGETIRGMLLSRFTDTALPHLPRAPYRKQGALTAWASGAWVLRRHANFCPNCLAADGQWRLEWKLPWAFACLEHMVYLRTMCTRCKLPQRGPNWGWDSRVCRLRVSAFGSQHSDHVPYRDHGMGLCGGRLDEDQAVTVTDPPAIAGQQRLMRWLYGAPQESLEQTEFASLAALAAQRLTPDMLRKAEDELRFTDADDEAPWPGRPPELRPVWTDPLRMAGAAHIAQRLSSSRYRPERAIQWLEIHQLHSDRLFHSGRQLYGTSLVFGPFQHGTEHMRHALHTGYVNLPYQGPAYVNDLSPYRVHPEARTRPPSATQRPT